MRQYFKNFKHSKKFKQLLRFTWSSSAIIAVNTASLLSCHYCNHKSHCPVKKNLLHRFLILYFPTTSASYESVAVFITFQIPSKKG